MKSKLHYILQNIRNLFVELFFIIIHINHHCSVAFSFFTFYYILFYCSFFIIQFALKCNASCHMCSSTILKLYLGMMHRKHVQYKCNYWQLCSYTFKFSAYIITWTNIWENALVIFTPKQSNKKGFHASEGNNEDNWEIAAKNTGHKKMKV